MDSYVTLYMAATAFSVALAPDIAAVGPTCSHKMLGLYDVRHTSGVSAKLSRVQLSRCATHVVPTRTVAFPIPDSLFT